MIIIIRFQKRVILFLSIFFIISVNYLKAQPTECDSTDVVCLQQKARNDMRALGERSLRDIEQMQNNSKPAIAYYNNVTKEMYVGDRLFKMDDRATAKQTWGLYNTKYPAGPGWNSMSENSYARWMDQNVNDNIESTSRQSENVYNNCVIERSKNRPANVMLEIRNYCRDISSNPSILDRWKYSN